MKKKILSVLLAALLCLSTPLASACGGGGGGGGNTPTGSGSVLTGLYVTGDDATAFAGSSYKVYQNGSSTAATDASVGAVVAGTDTSYKVTKGVTTQTYESVFWKVTQWNKNKDYQFTVTVKNNLTDPVNIRVLLSSVDSPSTSLGPTNVHHGDGYASDTNYTLAGGATRTYYVNLNPDDLYDTVTGSEKTIKGVYMRFNTHGTSLGAADVTISKAKLGEKVAVFDVADFAPLYGSNYHKTLTGTYDSSKGMLSAALYMGATASYSEANWGFDSQTSAWNASSHRYLHYTIKNITAEGKTNLTKYGISLIPVKGTGSSADAIGDDVNLQFDTNKQTLNGTIDLNDYNGFTTLRVCVNDRADSDYNVEIPDGIYVAFEISIYYSSSATANFGTLPTLTYTIPDMPAPVDPSDFGDGDLTGVAGVAQSVADKITVAVTKSEVVAVTDITDVVNKLVVEADVTFLADFNTEDFYTEFGGIKIDLSDFNNKGTAINWKFTNIGTAGAINFGAQVENAVGSDSPDGGTKKTLNPSESATRGSAIPFDHASGKYSEITEFRVFLGGAEDVVGKVRVELWFIVLDVEPEEPGEPEEPALPAIPTEALVIGGLHDGNGESRFVVTDGTVTLAEGMKAQMNNGKVVKSAVTNYNYTKNVFFVTLTNNDTTAIDVRITLRTSAKEWTDKGGSNGEYGQTYTLAASESKTVETVALNNDVISAVQFSFSAVGNAGTEVSVVNVTIANMGFKSPEITLGGLHDGNGESRFVVTDGTVTLAEGMKAQMNNGKVVKSAVSNHHYPNIVFKATLKNNDTTAIDVRITLRTSAKEWTDKGGSNGEYGQTFALAAGETKEVQTVAAVGDKIDVVQFSFSQPGDAGGEVSVVNVTISGMQFVAPTTTFGGLHDGNGESRFVVTDGTVTLAEGMKAQMNNGKVVKSAVTNYIYTNNIFQATVKNNDTTAIDVRITLRTSAKEWTDKGGSNGEYGQTFTIEPGATLVLKTAVVGYDIINVVQFSFSAVGNAGTEVSVVNVTISNMAFIAA